MWAGWVEDLVRRLGSALGRPVEAALYPALGFDPVSGRAAAGSPLAAMPMAALRRLSEDVLVSSGDLSRDAAARIVAAAWQPPDPVGLAHPLTDLPRLFRRLRAAGSRVAVATADDRRPTAATLAALGVLPLVDVLLCADDGLPLKPDPAMILRACRDAGVPPSATAVVGDAPADLEMGRSAGAGLVVGVLSGIGTRPELEPLADVVVPSIAVLEAELAARPRPSRSGRAAARRPPAGRPVVRRPPSG